jgi:hypothetical protein
MRIPEPLRASYTTTASRLVSEGVLQVEREARRIIRVRKPLPVKRVVENATSNSAIGVPRLTERVREVQRTMPPTPNLDLYVRARRALRVVPTENPYLNVELVENDIADEAIALYEFAKSLLEDR